MFGADQFTDMVTSMGVNVLAGQCAGHKKSDNGSVCDRPSRNVLHVELADR